MNIQTVSTDFARDFLNAYHPLRSGGALKGAIVCLAGMESGWSVFLAVFTYPRSRWKKYPVKLELSRLAWSGLAKHSASTFLRKCVRILRRNYDSGLIVTYALPGTEGVVYERAGFRHNGYSSGASWSVRGPGERATPVTVGTGQKLKRYFGGLNKKEFEMLFPEPTCKCCNTNPPGPSGLCQQCERELHSADEAQNYNGWALTDSDEYRETGE